MRAFLKLREMVEIEIGLFWLDRLTNWRKHKEIVEFLKTKRKEEEAFLNLNISEHFLKVLFGRQLRP